VTESGRVDGGVEDGATVLAGDPVVRLINNEMESRYLRLRSEKEINAARLEGARRFGNDDQGDAVAALETRRKELAGQLDLAIARRERLIIETPVAGRWMVVRSELNEVNANDSPNDSRTAPESSVWSGDPLHSVNQGCWLEAGTTIGWIVPNSGIWEIVGQVDEADMPRVRIGAEVTVRSASDGYRARTGRVVAIGVSSEDSARTGDRSSSNGAPLGLFDQGLDSKVGQVRIELGPFDAERDLVAPAFQGEPASITIRTDRESTAARAWRWIGRQVYWPW